MSVRTVIRNISGVAQTLPLPFCGVLGPAQAAVVQLSIADCITAFGGSDFTQKIWGFENGDLYDPTLTAHDDGFSQVISAGGRAAAALPMNTQKITGLGDPTAAQDAATKAYVDGLIGAVPKIGQHVANIAALKAVAAVDRVDGQLRVVEDDGNLQRSLYIFEDTSTADADDVDIVAPTAGTGRWFRAYDLAAGNIPITNATGGPLAANLCVAITGWDATKRRFEVDAASPTNPALWARGVLEASLPDTNSGVLQSKFNLATSGVDTSLAAVGDPVYMTTAGALTLTKPIQFLTQKVGVVDTIAADGDVRVDIEEPVTAFRNNVAGAAAPAVGNDDSEFYGLGSLWFDATNFKLYVCKDASTGAAVWVELLGSDLALGAEGIIRKSAVNTLLVHKTNLAAAADPGVVTGDSAAGYSIGSLWINTTSGRVFQAIDVSPGAAVWCPLLPPSSFGNAVAPAVGNDETEGYDLGSIWTDTTATKTWICTDPSTGAAVWADVSLATTALQKAGGQITGNVTCAAAETFDGRDLSVDGAKLDLIAAAATANVDCGDGSDGVVDLQAAGAGTSPGCTWSGTEWELDRDIYATTFNLDAGVELFTNNFAIFATTSVNFDGDVSGNGTDAVTSTKGDAQAAGHYFGGTDGGAGSIGVGAGAAGTNIAANAGGAVGGAGGQGDGGNAGGVAGTAPAVAAAEGGIRNRPTTVTGNTTGASGILPIYGGSGGGGGGCDATGTTGGGGGGGGGIVQISSPSITVGATGTITSSGGAGAAGVGANAGGGGGGGGGVVFLNYQTLTNGGTIEAAAGAAGAAAGTGAAGSVGTAGKVIQVVI